MEGTFKELINTKTLDNDDEKKKVSIKTGLLLEPIGLSEIHR